VSETYANDSKMSAAPVSATARPKYTSVVMEGLERPAIEAGGVSLQVEARTRK
jgi:hypothetical protein